MADAKEKSAVIELIAAVMRLVDAYDRGERPLTEYVKAIADIWHKHPRLN